MGYGWFLDPGLGGAGRDGAVGFTRSSCMRIRKILFTVWDYWLWQGPPSIHSVQYSMYGVLSI